MAGIVTNMALSCVLWKVYGPSIAFRLRMVPQGGSRRYRRGKDRTLRLSTRIHAIDASSRGACQRSAMVATYRSFEVRFVVPDPTDALGVLTHHG